MRLLPAFCLLACVGSSKTPGDDGIKDITLAEAKLALRAMIDVLKVPENKLAIETAMHQMLELPKPKSLQEAQRTRMMTMGSVLSQMLAEVTSKHGFEGGFLQATESIKKIGAAKNDREIAKGLYPIRELMTGEGELKVARMMKGRIPELDALVEGYLIKDKAGMKEAIDKVNATIHDEGKSGAKYKPMRLGKPLSKFYLQIMERVHKFGPNYAETEGKRLIQLLESNTTSPAKKPSYLKRLNIMGAFFTAEQLAEQKRKAELGEEDVMEDDDNAYPKDITLKAAKVALQAMLKVLQEPLSRKEIKEALDEMDKEQPMEGQTEQFQMNIRMNVLGPVLQTILAKVTHQHGFEGGFLQAWNTFREIGEKTNSEQLLRGMTPIGALMTGGRIQGPDGRYQAKPGEADTAAEAKSKPTPKGNPKGNPKGKKPPTQIDMNDMKTEDDLYRILTEQMSAAEVEVAATDPADEVIDLDAEGYDDEL